MIKELGKVAPYGVYVLNDNTGFVNLSKSSDTSEFAVESIRAWEALQKPSLILRPENFCLLHKLNFCANDCSGYF